MKKIWRPSEIVSVLKTKGFVDLRQTGSHLMLVHPDGRMAVVPMHSRDLKKGTLSGIMRQAGISLKDLND